MFLPLDQKPDWRNPPLVTLILVVANVLIFYIWQYNDERYSREAYEYYVVSGLIKTELNAYLQHIKKPDKLSEHDIETGSRKAREVFMDMRSDGKFQQLLENDKVIKPDDPDYLEWRPKHDRFKRLEQRIVAERYGISPANPTPTTLFTNMFLHGNDGHLLSNMAMLLLLGFGVEIIIGRLLFLLGYLLSGLTAGLLYVALFYSQAISGVGASGAIAGILGMSIMLYGFRKINFFYFLFVYFDYVKARAIWILPLYILSQLIIEFVFDTNVNVAAHIGGLLGGLIFIGILKLIPNVIKTEQIDQEREQENLQAELARARQFLAAMKFEEAQTCLAPLREQYAHDATVLQLSFDAARYNPASDDYHNFAHAIFNLPADDGPTARLMNDIFTDYAARAKPKPRWTPELLLNLAIRFAANGFLEDAEKIVNHLVNAARDFPRNAEGLYALARHYNGKDRDKASHYQQMLIQLFPDSQQAKQFARSAG